MSLWIEQLLSLTQSGEPFALVTITRCTGSTPREIGAKMFVLSSGSILGSVGGGHLEQMIISDALQCIKDRKSETQKYPLGAKTGQCCGGVVEVWIETLNVEPRLYIFGAGHVGRAVCQVMVGTPFRLELIDERESWISSSEIPQSIIRHAVAWDEFVEKGIWDLHTYVAVMTHTHELDQAIIACLLKKEMRYLGLIGSEAKWARFQERLGARGFSKDELFKVKCPMGFDIGGKAPKEVAISLASELLYIHYGSRSLSSSAFGGRQVESHENSEGLVSPSQ